jgi:pilus assembly protein CpaF
MDTIDIKLKMRQETKYLTDGWDGTNRDYLEGRMRTFFESWQARRDVEADPEVLTRAIKELCDDFIGFGPIQDLLDDPHVTEIMVNGPFSIYVERSGRRSLTDKVFDDEQHLKYTIDKMIAKTGRRVDESLPFSDFSLKDGARVNVTIPPISVDGISVTIRKLVESVSSMENIVQLGTLDVRMANFLIHCLRGRVNMLFSGATGSGKTTTISLLSAYIDDNERILTIEDTLELNLKQGNLRRLLTRPANIEGEGEIGIRHLFVNALRMRPSRILLGEIRGAEAMDYIQALNSGHRGALAVLHAATPEDAVTRLETMALYAGLNLPNWVIRRQIASGLDIIVQHEQLPDGSRKITHITELVGLDNNEVVLKDIFRYEVESMGADSVIKGRFVAVNPPSFLEKIRRMGIEMEDALFKN